MLERKRSSDLLPRPTLSSLAVCRSLFPYVYKVFHPKLLKLVGRMLPWPKLNHLMDLSETMNAEARSIYKTKKRLLELGDDATVKQVGEGKDIISLLSTYDAASFSTKDPDLVIYSARLCGGIGERSTERRRTACTNGVCPRVFLIW